MYAKLTNGFIRTAKEKYDTSEEYLEHGYKPVQYTDPPEAPSGYYYESGWEEQADAIVQVWTLTPLPDDIDDAEAYGIIFGGAE